MRSLIKSCAAPVLLSFAAILSAQTIVQPGQPVSSGGESATLTPVTSSSALSPETHLARVEDMHQNGTNRLWIVSMFAAATASGLDAATSWGKTEGNPLLASSNRTFGPKGVSIKAGILTAVLLPQILLRKHDDLKGIFTMGNLVDAAIFSGTAVHNLGIRPASTH